MSATTSTLGEQRVSKEAPSGVLVELSDLPDEERVVRPDVVRRLCVGPEAANVDPLGIRIRGARIVEALDLSFCTIPHPLRFEATTFEAAPDLSWARLPALRLVDCRLPGLLATRIRVEHDLIVASEVDGEVRLVGATIGGQLVCAGATLTNGSDVALRADGAQIGGGVFLNSGVGATGEHRPFSAAGQVGFPGATIGGELNCDGAILTNPGRCALFADMARVRGNVFLRRLAADTTATTDDAFLDEILGGALLDDGLGATVRLCGATIGGELSCSEATLTNEGGCALFADGARIDGNVFLDGGCAVTGEVRLLGATLGAQLVCDGATLTNEAGPALSADRARIGGDVLLRAGYAATGERRPFSAVGQVRLPGATIGGALECRGATFTSVGSPALVGRGATIERTFVFRDVRSTGGVDLSQASAQTLDDDLGQPDPLAMQPDRRLGSWSGAGPFTLDGFAYARFERGVETGAKLRQSWLEHTDGFQPSAWQQLIEVYRAQGRDDDATRTAIAMQNDRARRGGLPRLRAWGRRFVLRPVVGHGYRPWLAGIWAAAIIAAFALIVWSASDLLVPANEGVPAPAQPVAYAADTFLPIVDLGEADEWTPTGWLRWVTWSVILSGWALSTLFVAGFTRLVRAV